MNRSFSVFAAAFVKDLRLLWPLAALTTALILTQALYDSDAEMVLSYLPIAAGLASSLFVLVLIHQDPPASQRHDWLTRPIGRIDLVLAKAVLTALVVLLPAALGPAIAAVRDGATVPEAVLSALGASIRFVIAGFGLLVVAAVTSSLIEAVGVLIALFLFFVVVTPIAQQISGVGDGVLFTGAGWVVTSTLCLFLLIGGVVVLWLQYALRRTTCARTVSAGTLGVMALALALLNWDVLFAIQKAVADQDPAAPGVTLALAPGCFDTTLVDPVSEEVELRDGPWTADDRRAAGFGAVGFWTAVTGLGLPDDWQISVIHTRARYVDGQGATLQRVEPVRIMPEWRAMADGRLEARHAWLVNRAHLSKLLRQRVRFRLDYKLAVLAPVRVANIPSDGRIRRISGLGSCTAQARPGGAIAVSCFIAGYQPDIIAARLADAPQDQEVASKFPDFAPDALQLSAESHQMILPGSTDIEPPRVTITAYEARAHIARTITAVAPLGGPASACPIPGIF